MKNVHVNKDQQAQETQTTSQQPKLWKGFVILLRVANVFCTIVRWLEGDVE